MTLLVDTSVWSLALRRDTDIPNAHVEHLRIGLAGADFFVTTGLVLHELLQGFTGPKAALSILLSFRALPMLNPDRQDHIAAAEIHNKCRRSDVQIGTIDALLIQLCGRHDLTLLSTDRDFVFAAQHVPFRINFLVSLHAPRQN